MDYDPNKAESEETAPATENTKPPASTARRTATAVLVLVAALLLGYVLYDLLM